MFSFYNLELYGASGQNRVFLFRRAPNLTQLLKSTDSFCRLGKKRDEEINIRVSSPAQRRLGLGGPEGRWQTLCHSGLWHCGLSRELRVAAKRGPRGSIGLDRVGQVQGTGNWLGVAPPQSEDVCGPV